MEVFLLDKLNIILFIVVGKIFTNNFQVNTGSSLLGDDGVELFETEVVVGFSCIHDVSIVHHFSEFFIVKGLSELSCDSLEAIEVNAAIVFSVPQLVDLGDAIPGFDVADFGAHDLEEFFKLDGFVHFPKTIDHISNDFASALETKLFENLLDFDWVNSSSSILIEEIKGGFELLIIILIKPVLP